MVFRSKMPLKTVQRLNLKSKASQLHGHIALSCQRSSHTFSVSQTDFCAFIVFPSIMILILLAWTRKYMNTYNDIMISRSGSGPGDPNCFSISVFVFKLSGRRAAYRSTLEEALTEHCKWIYYSPYNTLVVFFKFEMMICFLRAYI